MPSSTKKRSTTRSAARSANRGLSHYAVYAPLGAGQVLVERTRDASLQAWKFAQKRRTDIMNGYDDLATRGEKLVSSVRRSAYTRRAIEQAKLARSQVKAAATSVRKTAGATTRAAKSAAKKVG